MVSVAQLGMPLKEYLQIFEEEGPFEWINGERIDVMPSKEFGHSNAANILARALDRLESGTAFVETPFILPTAEDPTLIRGARIPDAMFILNDRLEVYKSAHDDWLVKPLGLVPDIVAEVISPSDTYLEVTAKIDTYLLDGVQQAWIINIEQRTVTIYTPLTKQQVILTHEDQLTGGDTVPEFSIRVVDLFV